MAKIFNILGWVGMAMIFAVAGIRLFVQSQTANQYAYYLTIAGLVCMLLYIGSQWREFASMFSRRNARYGGLAASSVLIFLGILIAVNYIGKRQNKRWDFTASQQYSLADQSRQVLTKLDAPLNVTVFEKEEAMQPFRDRLGEYAYTSDQVKVEYVDPDKDPTRAQQSGVQSYGTIVVDYKGRTERTTQNTEQDITNTIIKAVSGEQRKVYFTQGHGEKDPVSQDERAGYSAIDDALKRENYAVEKLVLAQKGAVPDDASLVVVAGPITDFFPPEVEALKAYLGKQGKLLLMLDPPEKPDAPELTNLIGLAKDWGIEAGRNIVVDASPMGRMFGLSALVPVAANYPPHPITDRFQVLTAYPITRSIAPGTGSEGRTPQTIIESGPDSWAETDLKGLTTGGTPSADEASGDKRGPIPLAVAVSLAAASTAPAEAPNEGPKPEARLVVFGDSDFAANRFLGIQGNRDLFMNTIGWLSQQENLISIRPKEAQDRRITLTAQQQTTINWLSLAIIPLAIFGTGVYSWWRRR
jgi:ABC-type uncharacterized transport system involved in gliding motility auxiliary subunit